MKPTNDLEKKWFERMEENEVKSILKRDRKTALVCLIIGIIILATASLFASCSNENESGLKTPYSFYWETRHDAIPEVMIGEWVSVNDKEETILIVTENDVMTKDFTVNPRQGNAVNVENRMYTVYQNSHTYTLAFGTGQHAGQITITVDNKCYGTVTLFQQTNLN